jgi:hypothetical protein
MQRVGMDGYVLEESWKGERGPRTVESDATKDYLNIRTKDYRKKKKKAPQLGITKWGGIGLVLLKRRLDLFPVSPVALGDILPKMMDIII